MSGLGDGVESCVDRWLKHGGRCRVNFGCALRDGNGDFEFCRWVVCIGVVARRGHGDVRKVCDRGKEVSMFENRGYVDGFVNKWDGLGRMRWLGQGMIGMKDKGLNVDVE